jgi:hypothetical protein
MIVVVATATSSRSDVRKQRRPVPDAFTHVWQAFECRKLHGEVAEGGALNAAAGNCKACCLRGKLVKIPVQASSANDHEPPQRLATEPLHISEHAAVPGGETVKDKIRERWCGGGTLRDGIAAGCE